MESIYSVKQKSGGPKKGPVKSRLRVRVLEGGSGVVVLVEYFAFVDAHDPVESDY